jgi:selenocysteine-specific elongation factor
MIPPLKSIVIGTAGHIDHGKTALIRALTGVDTDRLPEEKRRGITIDLGFASLEDKATDGTPLRISFVDVPGHANFIRNMLAGTGGIDAVMLVIAADEGIKPQTEEHLAICGLLGVPRGITVISKIDAVNIAHLDQVVGEVEAFLSGTFLDVTRSKIIPVSARNGEGLAELRCTLRDIAKDIGSFREPDYLPRLPIDRTFVMRGFGTVITGTLLSGSICSGESVALEPGGRTLRVRGLQTHGRSEERVYAGSRVALNIAGVEISEINRGQTIVQPETLTATSTIDADVTLLPGVAVLKHRALVHFHAFTADTLASVSLYGYNSAEAGSKRLMRLKLHKPVLLLPEDRFVLRQLSPAMTIGGGRVLDAQPIARLKKAKCLAWLESIRDASLEEQLRLRIGRRGTHGLSVPELIRETGLTQEAISRSINALISGGKLIRFSDHLLLTREAVEAAAQSILLRLEMKSDQKGIKLSELKSQTGLNGEVIESLIERFAIEQKLRRQAEMVYPSGTELQLSADNDSLQSKIEAIYKSAGLASPSTNEVVATLGIKDDEMRLAMTMLLRDKTVIRMGTDPIYIHSHALDELRAGLRQFQGQAIDVARFKQITGLSRKYAIPLLEYLDRERATRKEGDRRLVL